MLWDLKARRGKGGEARFPSCSMLLLTTTGRRGKLDDTILTTKQKYGQINTTTTTTGNGPTAAPSNRCGSFSNSPTSTVIVLATLPVTRRRPLSPLPLARAAHGVGQWAAIMGLSRNTLRRRGE